MKRNERPTKRFWNASAIALGVIGALAGTLPTAGFAQSETARYFRDRAATPNVPSVLSHADREYYRTLFGAIDEENWSRVDMLFAQRNDGPLHVVARAEYYLHANSPRVEAGQIMDWMASGRNLPQAEQMNRLGERRGLDAQYSLPDEQAFYQQASTTKRVRPSAVNDGTMPGTISDAILDRIKNDDPDGARQLLDGIDATLSPAARAEWRQRVAFSYYIENNDPAAFALARTVNDGSGAWVAEGNWVAGLAAWRMGDCGSAGAYFEQAAGRSTNAELTAAARYWAARSYTRCRAPEKVTEQLRAAARLDETLYGMLAREQLGQDLPQTHASADFDDEDWAKVSGVPNVRIAIALSEIGEDALADEVLRHQARIGDASQYDELSRLARELGVPSTQLWMAHNAPRGAQAEPALRFPTTRWQPINGWKVDPALAFAHTLQESNFRPKVVSPAGARGLMQIMPAAAIDHRGRLGVRGDARDLSKPAINLAFGQEHLNMLRTSAATQGLLPKIMAAYNAGLTPVTRWNSEIRDQGDALLYMESIPYWETRGYVAIVMRNYWMYERQAGGTSTSRHILAQNQWPGFPDLDGSRGIRMTAAD